MKIGLIQRRTVDRDNTLEVDLIIKKKAKLMKALKHELDRLPPRDYVNFLHGVEECPITNIFKMYCTCDMCIRELIK